MSAIDASTLLRPGLLQGLSVVLAGAPGGLSGEGLDGSLAGEVGAACSGLGARVVELALEAGRLDGGGGGWELGEDVERLLAEGHGEPRVLVLDGAGLFAAALATARSDGEPRSARAALRACLDAGWSATHALVNRSFLPGGRGGRIVYITPAADAGEHSHAARSGLENLARTLSIEWARHGITIVAVVPASGIGGDCAVAVAALTAYLASPAGAYFSGCVLDLSGIGSAGGVTGPQNSV